MLRYQVKYRKLPLISALTYSPPPPPQLYAAPDLSFPCKHIEMNYYSLQAHLCVSLLAG